MGIECVDYGWILYVKYDGEDKRSSNFFVFVRCFNCSRLEGKNQNDNA